MRETLRKEVLEQRERDRKDRTLGKARLQFGIIHKYAIDDLELDTFKLGTEECAQHIMERLQDPPAAFGKLKSMDP